MTLRLPTPHLRGSTWRTLVAGSVAALVTAVEIVSPAVRFAYRSPDGRLVVETVASLIAGLVALLLFGRLRRTGSLEALFLVYSLGLLSVAALGFVVLPTLAGAPLDSAAITWAPIVVRLAAALFLLAAAVVPAARVTPNTHPSRHAMTLIAVLAGLGAVVGVLAGRLPTAVETTPPPEASAYPSFEAHPLALGAQALTLVCFVVAAIAFTRRAAATDDDLAGWIGAACAVGVMARLNYLLYPSLYSGWLYTGDLVRLGFYILLLVGAVRELQVYWAAQAESAVAEERRRLARELHDGALQEIGFIRAQMRTLDGPVAGQVRSASERALDETRAAVAALTAPAEESLEHALRRRIGEIADRHGLTVRWSVEYATVTQPPHREEIIRVAREALTNAARHGGARLVDVRLRPGELVIRDDGTGFDTQRPPRPGAFGLVSMRERAEGLGGSLDIRSAPESGTEVRLTWAANS